MITSEKILENIFEKTHLFKLFWKGTKGLYICVLLWKRERILRELNCQNLSKQLWPNSCKLWRILLGTSLCIIYSKGDKSFYTSHILSCNQETICLWAYENLEHKGEGSQGVFRDCKGFTKIVENLKWVTWGLDLGTGSGWTSINRVCNSLFHYLIYFIAIDFVLHT